MADDEKVLMRLKKVQLVEACKAVGLSTDGVKVSALPPSAPESRLATRTDQLTTLLWYSAHGISQAELVDRLVEHGKSKNVSSKQAAAPAPADSDSDGEDDGAVPTGVSFAAARQAAIAAEAAEADAAARLAQKRRKRPRKAEASAAAASDVAGDSDEELDDSVFQEAAEAAEAEAEAEWDEDEGEADRPGAAAAGQGRSVTLKAKGRRMRRKGTVKDELGRHVVFGDDDDVVLADSRRQAANAAAFLQGHFYGGRLDREDVRRAAGRRLGPASGFGTGREPARRPSKRGRR